jgi:hypothetical protein
LELGLRAEALRERHIPDLARPLPGVAADGRGHQVEGAVRDAGLDVHAAVVVARVVVVRQVHEAVHRIGLVVEPVRRAGRLQRPQRLALELRRECPFADQPVRLVGGLAEAVLLHEGPEHVRERLVQRPRLLAVAQIGGEVGDPVRELVGDYGAVARHAAGEEHAAAALAVDHLGAGPGGVVVLDPVVHRGDDLEPGAVDAVAVEDVPEDLVGLLRAHVRLVHRRVVRLGIALAANALAGAVEVAAVVDV